MLKENKSDYQNSLIDKYEYMGRMHDVHKILYEYAEYINKSNVIDITIANGEVYFNFLNNGVQIKMVCIPYDITSVPFTFLDFGSYEHQENQFLLDIVTDNSVALDIGANVGWFTLNWLKKSKNVRVFSFEPITDTYNKLVQNLVLNGLQIRDSYNFGLSNAEQEIDFYFDTERCGASSMVNLRDTDKTLKVKCKLKRLDDVFPSLGVDKLDLIKCDVEGAEKLVFEGGLETIKKYQPVVFSEMLRKWSKKFGYHPNDIINLFREIGYGCFVIRNNRLFEFETVTEETVETNYVFLNMEKHKEIMARFLDK